MVLGIIASPKEESFKKAAENNLSFLEFCLDIGYNLKEFFDNVENIKSWVNKYNVQVGSMGRWGTDRINKDGTLIDEELQISYKLIDAASTLGCTNFICGSNYVEELSYYENCTSAINYFSKLISYGKDKGVKISTYNCRWNNFVVEPMAWTLVHGHLKDLGIKFDPSHSIAHGGDYLKEMRDWGHRFYHVHIKGSLINEGSIYDNPPAGMDETNWGAFMSILYAEKYQGRLSIEPHSENWKGDLGEKGVQYTIKYIRSMMF